jgi:mannose-6-phosphate isomerase-like protein (cupin superfamily)
MKRRNFLLTSLLVIPAVSFARFKNLIRSKPYKVDAGTDRFDKPLSLFEGDKFYCKVSTTDTNGDMYMFESTRDKKGGPPLHYHYEQDEWWYILEGEFLFKIGDETFNAKAGDSFFGPRMIPHAFAKTNEGAARMLILYQPAGRMEAHFKAVSEGSYAKLSDEEKDKFRQANGFKVVGPALTYLKQ